jgi:poly-gamma-glutamate capsule biosynthesis protein CapA/YwtB (metallophosphatase superfamily)
MGEAFATLFLAGDVMTGRGVDQILTHPSAPELHEPFVTDAREYVRLAEHHVRPIEVYRERLILYGCGDFIDDYEGISGYERYRDDLVLMFFPTVNPVTSQLAELQMTPMQIRKIRLNRASSEDARWMCDMLNRVGRAFGVHAELMSDGTLKVRP